MNNTSVDICARCGQQIYPLELMGQIMGLKYHKQCFKCSVCDRNLDFKTYQTNLIDLADKQIYCASHSPKNGKGTIDFNAADNIPKTIANEFANETDPIENKAAEIVLSVITKSAENIAKEEVVEDVKEMTIEDRTPLKSFSDSIGVDEVTWKEIYESDEKKSYHGSSGALHTQQSNDSAFYKRSQENLDGKWDYLDFKAGTGHPRNVHNRMQSKSPEAYRRQAYGPFDSAYRQRSPHDMSKATWKEIFDNGDKNIHTTSKTRLDLLDKNELSWKEIYENDYHFSKKASTHDLTEEVYQFDPKDFEPQPVIEKVIESMTIDSSLVNKIPSKEKISGSISSSERTKSESYTSTKETSTYHHQLSENSKTLVDQPTAEERQRVLDELLKKNSVPKTPEQPKKVIEPLVVNKETLVPVEQPKPAIVTQKSTETKIIGENKNYGVVKLTVHYDELRHRLSITCHQAQNLKNVEKKGLSDPYCRIYLVPDDKKTFKRKTKVVKENLNPKWEETFDYKLTYEQSIAKDLIVSLKDDKKGLFSKQETRMLGEVRLKLSEPSIKKPYTRWFFLQPLGQVSKLLLNSGINPYKK